MLSATAERRTLEWAVELEAYFNELEPFLVKRPPPSRPPLTIVLFADDRHMEPFRPDIPGHPAPSPAYYLERPTGAILLTLPDTSRENVRRLIFHVGLHWLTGSSSREVPPWYVEGLAELFSSFVVDGQHRTLGSAIPPHLALLRSQPLLPLETLLNVDRTSVYYDEVVRDNIFYAECWALLHVAELENAESLANAPKTYLALRKRDVPAADAFQQAFKMDYAQMTQRLSEFARAKRIAVSNRVIDRVALEKKIVRPEISAADVDLTLAAVQAAVSHYEASEKLLRPLRQLHPTDVRVLTVAMDSAFSQRQFDVAYQLADQMIAGGGTEPYLYWYRASALLGRRSGEYGRLDINPKEARAAADDLVRVIRLWPDDRQPYEAFAGVITAAQPNTSDDYAILEEGLARWPEVAMFLTSLGSMDEAGGHREKARKRYEQLLAMEPPVAPALRLYAEGRMKAWEAADKAATQRTQVTATVDPAANELGEIEALVAKKDYAKAHERLMNLMPNVPPMRRTSLELWWEQVEVEHRYEDAEKLATTGEREEAISELQELLEQPKVNYTTKRKAQTLLKKLEKEGTTQSNE